MNSFILYGFLSVQPLITAFYRVVVVLSIYKRQSYRLSSEEAWLGHHLRLSSEAPLILHLLQRGQANLASLRASSDHRFTVGALRARRMVACPLASL